MKKKIRIAVVAMMAACLLALCACTGGQPGTSSGQSSTSGAANAASSAAVQTDANREIQVKVLDEVRQSIWGEPFDKYQLVTKYEYDAAGNVIASSQSTNYPESDVNLRKQTFEYDAAGNLAQVSNAYEQYDWNVGNIEKFTYDDKGLCATYSQEIVSEGMGGTKMEYAYDEKGVLVSAVELLYFEGIDIDAEKTNLNWQYLENGMVEKITTSTPAWQGFDLVHDRSDINAGLYVYDEGYGIQSFHQFDEKGCLQSMVLYERDSELERYEYKYKTITVKASEFKPSIFSNPNGFTACWKPQLTAAEIAQIKGA